MPSVSSTPPQTPPVTDTSGSSVNSVNNSIGKQKEILDTSMQANIAMAYLQMALGVSSKISGR
jgi:hypothetical protein